MSKTAANHAALARALGVSRQSVWNWRNDARISPHLPGKGPNGHDVEAWRRVMLRFNLRDCRADIPGPDGKSVNDLRCELLAEKVRRLKVENDIASRKAVLVADLERHLGTLLSAIMQIAEALPDRIAPMIQGLTDRNEIARIIREELNAMLGPLEIANFDKAVENVPEADRRTMKAALRSIEARS